jgi:hypothetical protein
VRHTGYCPLPAYATAGARGGGIREREGEDRLSASLQSTYLLADVDVAAATHMTAEAEEAEGSQKAQALVEVE